MMIKITLHTIWPYHQVNCIMENTAIRNAVLFCTHTHTHKVKARSIESTELCEVNNWIILQPIAVCHDSFCCISWISSASILLHPIHNHSFAIYIIFLYQMLSNPFCPILFPFYLRSSSSLRMLMFHCTIATISRIVLCMLFVRLQLVRS